METSPANIASAKLFYSKINLSRAVDSGPRIGCHLPRTPFK
jgi:hypothetical protein